MKNKVFFGKVTGFVIFSVGWVKSSGGNTGVSPACCALVADVARIVDKTSALSVEFLTRDIIKFWYFKKRSQPFNRLSVFYCLALPCSFEFDFENQEEFELPDSDLFAQGIRLAEFIH